MSDLTRKQLLSTFERVNQAFLAAVEARGPEEEIASLQDLVQLSDSLKVAAIAQSTSISYAKRRAQKEATP